MRSQILQKSFWGYLLFLLATFLFTDIVSVQANMLPGDGVILPRAKAQAVNKALDQASRYQQAIALPPEQPREQDLRDRQRPLDISQDKTAEEKELTVEKVLDKLQKGEWEFGAEASQIIYKEPGVMKEKGNMYGAFAAYTYRGWLPPVPEENTNYMLRLEGKYSSGRVDYQNSGVIDNIDDFLVEFRGLAGADFNLLTRYLLTPYAGIGYRYLNDNISGRTSSTGAKGYERESNYYYIPIGVEASRELVQGWHIEARLEYDYFLSGKQISHLSNVTPNYNDLKNDQDKGYGLRGSLRLKKKFEYMDFVLEPFIRYWNIAKSNDANLTYAGVIIGYGYEPKNNSTEYGIKLAAHF